MKILVINGSPKAEQSNTMKLTNAFLKGLGENTIKTMNLSKMNIRSCNGCFSCWKKTPGRCIITDDMREIIENQLWAELIVWSFPLYYFNVPGILKNMIDRQLPMSLPFMSKKNVIGSGSHESRYEMSGKRHILISTCGFYSAENNYDSVEKMFDHFLGKDNYEKIFCGQGELFNIPEVKVRTEQYLDIVKKAGEEYACGGISLHVRNELKELLYPKDVFEKMADSSWGIEKDTGKISDESLAFTEQMAALYNKNSYDGKKRVLEICYTDLGKTYQIEMNAEGSRVLTDNNLIATTRIETPWEIWKSIARGEIRGDVALSKGLYRVTGDFSLMINWDRFFGNYNSNKSIIDNKSEKKSSKPLMVTMLFAWIIFWCGISINPVDGGMVALICCSLIPVFMFKRLIKYDILSCCFVEILSLLAIISKSAFFPMVLGYGIFGLMWLISCMTKEPLCAAYVKYDYNGDDALNNPIFMKTNRIIAFGWGVLYILIAFWSCLLLNSGYCLLLQIINNSITIMMGIFTVWFVNWYPAHIARG